MLRCAAVHAKITYIIISVFLAALSVSVAVFCKNITPFTLDLVFSFSSIMVGCESAPVARRTRLQMNRSHRKIYFQSIRSRDVMNGRGAKQLPCAPEAACSVKAVSGASSEPKFDRKLSPNAVRDSEFVEFLLVDRDGNVRKFYIDGKSLKDHVIDSVEGLDSKDEGLHCDCVSRRNMNSPLGNSLMEMNDAAASHARVSSPGSPVNTNDSENENRPSIEGKETIEGTSSALPIILSDDEQDEPKHPSANRHGGGRDTSKERKECMPLKKRQKFDEQEFPGLPMNSSLEGVDAQSYRDVKGDKLFKDMNSTALKPKEIEAENPLVIRSIKKEMMEAKSL